MTERSQPAQLPSNGSNVVKLANQDELAKARETLSKVVVPDLPAEIIARAYMRLQCADVPREPWHWEVSQILQTPQMTGNETPACIHPVGDLYYHGFVSGTVGDFRCNLCDEIIQLPHGPRVRAAQKALEPHRHNDECWEPDSGCDMGRSEVHAVKGEPLK